MDKLVTVAIALYNNANYIERCVKSVIAQTYSNLEILLVDDGSTDDSLQRVEKYKSEGRLRVITKENGGLSSVRQVALDEATGDFICFIDADDYILKDYVSEMLSQIIKDGSNICISSTRFEDEKGSVNYSDTSFFKIPKNKIPLDCSDEVLLNNPSQVIKDLHLSDSWNKMYSTSFLRDTNISFSMPKGLNGTDSSFNKKIVFHNPRYSFVSSICYVHVNYKSSAVHRKNKRLLSSYILIAKQMLQELEKLNKKEKMLEVVSQNYLQDLRSAYQDVFNEHGFGFSIFKVFSSLYEEHNSFFCKSNLQFSVSVSDTISQKLFLILLANAKFLLPLYFEGRKLLISREIK